MQVIRKRSMIAFKAQAGVTAVCYASCSVFSQVPWPVCCCMLCCLTDVRVQCVCTQDSAGHHSSALFVQWVPYELSGTTWEAEEEKYVKHLLDIVDEFAPGVCVCVCWWVDGRVWKCVTLRMMGTWHAFGGVRGV